jgi:hypothetical protein
MQPQAELLNAKLDTPKRHAAVVHFIGMRGTPRVRREVSLIAG